jgi:hypothetical protein
MNRSSMQRTTVKRAVIAAALVLGSLSPAFAATHYVMKYHDMVHPNGHKISNAVFNAALNACYAQTGLSRNAAATQAFKDCMKAHNLQWVWTKLVKDPPSQQTSDDGSFIDPDTGMQCQEAGGGQICVPPQGTVHYTNQHGLNCTRTGIMSVCGGF